MKDQVDALERKGVAATPGWRDERRFAFQLTDLEARVLIADCESIRITKAFVVMRRALTARDTGAVESYERFCYTLDLKEKWICRR